LNGFAHAGTASGTFVNCTAGAESFAADGGTFSGTAYGCVGGQYSFAGKSGSTLSGKCYDCHVPDGYGFASAGTLTGEVYRCTTTLLAFGLINATGASSKVVGCTLLNAVLGPFIGGLMERCIIETTGANSDAAKVADGARIYDCTLIATGTGKSVNADSAVNAAIAHCRMNKGIDANVTNDIGTPYNVDDTDIEA
jgi:hypothetical protein